VITQIPSFELIPLISLSASVRTPANHLGRGVNINGPWGWLMEPTCCWLDIKKRGHVNLPALLPRGNDNSSNGTRRHLRIQTQLGHGSFLSFVC